MGYETDLRSTLTMFSSLLLEYLTLIADRDVYINLELVDTMPRKTEYPTTQNEYVHLIVKPGIPESVSLKDIQDYHEGTDSLGNKIARFRFNGKNLLKAYLPLEANPREPGSSTAVSRMRLTLQDDAASFHLKNNGLTVFSTSVSYDAAKKT